MAVLTMDFPPAIAVSAPSARSGSSEPWPSLLGAGGLSLALHLILFMLLAWHWQPVPPPPAPQQPMKAQMVALLPAPRPAPPAAVPVPEPTPPPAVAPPPPRPVEQATLARQRLERQQREQQRKQQTLEQQRQREQRLEQERQAQAEQQRLAALAAAEQARPQDYAPLHKPVPDYPEGALSRGIEGDCTVEYTVNAAGRVENPTVVGDCHPLFIRPSLNAAKAFRYQPRTVNGQPQAVAKVRNTFHYRIDARP